MSVDALDRAVDPVPERRDEEKDGGGFDLRDLVRNAAAGALVAAGLVHFAYAPTHLHEAFSHGMFFLVAGWAQLALAAGLALQARPQRVWLLMSALVNTAIIAVWIISRTTGVPGSEAEGVGFPDSVATTLEALVVLAVTALLLDRLPHRRFAGRSVFGLAGVSAVASVVVVSFALSPSFAGEHGPGQGAHGDGGGAAGEGHGSEEAGTEDWAQTRIEALEGSATPEQVEEFKRLEGGYLADQIRNRSELLQGLPESEREDRIATYVDWAVNNTIALLDDAQSNGEEMHTHGPVEWQPLDNTADRLALQGQLQASARVIEQFPTIADAEAAGYRQISPYVPGIGAHWINGDFDGTFDPAKPEMLLFNGTEPTSRIVGLSYATVGPEPPDGFVGPNDVWHTHPGLCMLGGLVVGIDGTPEDLCESIGGDINTGLGNLWMGHLWQVPGFESSWGLFSAENDSINVATSDLGRSLVE